jgi:outer membrane protein assembly factor BamA
MREFEFRGAPRKTGSAEGGCEEPDAPGREFQGTRVGVQEQPTGSLMFGVGVNSDAGLVGSIVLNERNFDILRPPTGCEALLCGRAFRGAGQELRLEAVPGTQLQRYSISCREPFRPDRPSGSGVNSDAGLAGSIVLNEKNFDILRAPLNSPECRSPIGANDPLHLVAFLDAGTVERTASLSDYRVAAGAGLRITVPALGPVPIALDFGFPVVNRPEAPEQLFSFWMGFFS